MRLFGLSIVKSRKNLSGACQYSDSTDAICQHLSNITTDRDNTMLAQFKKQNDIINKHNSNVLSEIKTLREISARKEKRLTDLERYIKPHNMESFDSIMKLKWVIIFWVISITALETIEIILFFIKK